MLVTCGVSAAVACRRTSLIHHAHAPPHFRALVTSHCRMQASFPAAIDPITQVGEGQHAHTRRAAVCVHCNCSSTLTCRHQLGLGQPPQRGDAVLVCDWSSMETITRWHRGISMSTLGFMRSGEEEPTVELGAVPGVADAPEEHVAVRRPAGQQLHTRQAEVYEHWGLRARLGRACMNPPLRWGSRPVP